MKKLTALLVAVLMLASMATTAFAGYSSVTAAKIDTPPTLDGVISEDEWGTPICSLNSYEEVLPYCFSWMPQDWPEYMEQYGDLLDDRTLIPSMIKFWFRWDDDYFYLGVQIKQETRSAPLYKDLWKKDSVVLNISVDPYTTVTTDCLFNEFTVHDDGDFIYDFEARGAYDVNPTTTDGEWVGVRDESTKITTYELKFYWDELLPQAVTKQMVIGDMFGFNITVQPANFDGDPTNVVDIVPAGISANEDYGDDRYNYAITLGDVETDVAAAPAETETEAPAVVAEPSAWAVEEVNAAIAAGLVPAELQKNYTDGISRADLSKMLGVLIDKAYGQEPATADAAFTDTTDAAVMKAANLGIINGYKQDDGTFMFKPENTLKRSEMSAIINRVAKLCGEETTGFDAEVKFEDTASHWCNAELGYPVHMGIVKGTSDTTFSPENTLTVEQTIMMVYRTFTALQK